MNLSPQPPPLENKCNPFGVFCVKLQLKITHPFWRKWKLSLLRHSLYRKFFFLFCFFIFSIEIVSQEREFPFPPKWVGNFQLKITTKYLWKVAITSREGVRGTGGRGKSTLKMSRTTLSPQRGKKIFSPGKKRAHKPRE